MASWGRRALRERFDDAHHPEPRESPITHRCDRYLATDAAVIERTAGLGAILETPGGKTIARWCQPGRARDNNDAELQALHFGLDRMARRGQQPERVGILLDHDALAYAAAACAHPNKPSPAGPPTRTASPHHWGGITARIAAIPDVRVALADGPANPAHSIANRIAAD